MLLPPGKLVDKQRILLQVLIEKVGIRPKPDTKFGFVLTSRRLHSTFSKLLEFIWPSLTGN